MNEIHQRFRRQGLVRPRDGRILAGVCAGLGRRFGIDPWPARLLFVLALCFLHVSVILAYVILWILMPAEESAVEELREPSTYPAAVRALSTVVQPPVPTRWLRRAAPASAQAPLTSGAVHDHAVLRAPPDRSARPRCPPRNRPAPPSRRRPAR